MRNNSMLMTLLALATLSILFANPVAARDTRHNFPVSDVLDDPEYADRLHGVAFFFAAQEHPEVQKNFGEFQTNRKTNAFGKQDKTACDWAFLSALVTLHQRALSEGGNAVINIRSNYKSEPFVSESEYRCGAGAIMAGVTLVGDVVLLEE